MNQIRMELVNLNFIQILNGIQNDKKQTLIIYFATFTALVSRITVTLTWPG
jgi:hypothetical protein